MIISEKRLIAACTALAAAGIIALFVTAAVSEPKPVSVQEAAGSAAGTGDAGTAPSTASGKVKISGFVNSVTFNDGYAVVKIAELKAVDAVSFDAEHLRRLNLTRLQEVEVIGELRNYRGKASLIVSKIKPKNTNSARICGG